MMVGRFSTAALGLMTFLIIAGIALSAGLRGVQAMYTNYTLTLRNLDGLDIDRDGISDRFDDSDSDTIPDYYDAKPLRTLDSFVNSALQ